MPGDDGARDRVRDDPVRPDPGFAALYGSLEDATELEPWLGWCRRARGPVLYVGPGAGRLAVPLAAAGIEVVGLEPHPGMAAQLRARLPEMEVIEARVESVRLGGRRFELVMGPAHVLGAAPALAAAAALSNLWVGLELVNPHWLEAGAGGGVRVLRLGPRSARLEIDYPGGVTQVARIGLVRPERIEPFLGRAGLRLDLLAGSDPESEPWASPTYYVRASLSRRARIPFT